MSRTPHEQEALLHLRQQVAAFSEAFDRTVDARWHDLLQAMDALIQATQNAARVLAGTPREDRLTHAALLLSSYFYRAKDAMTVLTLATIDAQNMIATEDAESLYASVADRFRAHADGREGMRGVGMHGVIRVQQLDVPGPLLNLYADRGPRHEYELKNPPRVSHPATDDIEDF